MFACSECVVAHEYLLHHLKRAGEDEQGRDDGESELAYLRLDEAGGLAIGGATSDAVEAEDLENTEEAQKAEVCCRLSAS